MSEHGTGASSSADDVGSVGEEAAKLMAAFSQWARDHGGEAASAAQGMAQGMSHGMSQAAREVDDHLATGAPECRWCPVCQVVHLVRETSPEVRAHLASAAASLAQALAGALATQPPSERSGRPVEHIDLDETGPDETGPDESGPDERGPA